MCASKQVTRRLVAALAALTLCVFCAHTSAQTPPRPPADAPAATPTPAATPAAAQPATPVPSPAREVSEDEADLVITARVTARELRFDAVPNPSVEFRGRPERATAWEAERTNLPRPVQPGVTYRDIGVRLKIVSVFADIDRIVAEALGERPQTDDAPPAPPPGDTQTGAGRTANAPEAPNAGGAANTTSMTNTTSTTNASNIAKASDTANVSGTTKVSGTENVSRLAGATTTEGARASRTRQPPRRAGGRRARWLR